MKYRHAVRRVPSFDVREWFWKVMPLSRSLFLDINRNRSVCCRLFTFKRINIPLISFAWLTLAYTRTTSVGFRIRIFLTRLRLFRFGYLFGLGLLARRKLLRFGFVHEIVPDILWELVLVRTTLRGTGRCAVLLLSALSRRLRWRFRRVDKVDQANDELFTNTKLQVTINLFVKRFFKYISQRNARRTDQSHYRSENNRRNSKYQVTAPCR